MNLSEFAAMHKIKRSNLVHLRKALGLSIRQGQNAPLDVMTYWILRIAMAVRRALPSASHYQQKINSNPDWLFETALYFSLFPNQENKRVILTSKGVRAYRSERQLSGFLENNDLVEVVRL